MISDISFKIGVQIMNSKYDDLLYTFIDTASVAQVVPKKILSKDHEIRQFVFIVQSNIGKINLPNNMPNQLATNYPNFLLEYV